MSGSASSDDEQLAAALGCTRTLARVLLGRGLADPEAARSFLAPRLGALTPPDAMADRDVAAARLARAVAGGESIAVFGDYDCDGITATAVVTEALRALGGAVTPLLASRYAGGYGVSRDGAERIRATGAGVVVTCDCGSSDHATLGPLRDEGRDIIVIDHHLVPPEPLPALAFLNPHRPECGFPYRGLASCGLAFVLMAAVRRALGRELDLHALLDLVALGTIADVAPLDGDNRILVRAGLERLRRAERPGVRALFEVLARDTVTPVTGHEVGFRLAPRLNAPGRLGAPDLSLELLLAKSLAEARGLAAQVEQVTARRRELTRALEEEAAAEVEREGWGSEAAIVVGRAGWSPGVVGIVAGRLAERHGRPAVVVGFDSGRGTGSVRGPAGWRLFDWIASAAPLLERFGGHQAAAGLEVREERLPTLRAALVASAPAHAPEPGAAVARAVAVPLAVGDPPERVLADLLRLEPCGEANPPPTLAVEATLASTRQVRGGHLKLELALDGGGTLPAFAPNAGGRACSRGERVRILGELRHDTFRGGGAAELLVQALEAAGQEAPAPRGGVALG
ncbi:MAG: single-stranded-DNA-specific exonuclease RecJ [Polyangiaceae bacterium]|nr:single-stranded-DNA-specific exonuclease RecJ [Polyangiaceae bacterium]